MKNNDEISIAIKLVNTDQLKAICSINYGDHVIRGFRIAPSKFQDEASGEYLRVLPPAYGVGGETHLAFFMENKESWKELVNKIIQKYLATFPGVSKSSKFEDLPF